MPRLARLLSDRTRAGSIKRALDPSTWSRRLKVMNTDAQRVMLWTDALHDFIAKEIPLWQEFVRLAELPIEN